MTESTVIIDAATRFLRSNAELLEFARRGAGEPVRGSRICCLMRSGGSGAQASKR